MAKGFFTQGLVILLKSPVEIGRIREQLSAYSILKQIAAADDPWFSGPTVIVDYRPEVNGKVSVDIVSAPWPDHMGDSKKEVMLLGAWSMGHFGPYAYPFGLRRATQQSWRWKGAPDAVKAHTAFLRLRITYIAGAKDPVMPKDCDPEHELQFLTRMASTLLDDPAALCYFNPSGEVLLPKTELDDSLKYHAEHELPPLDIWSNIRLFNLDPQWLLMDSIGLWQLNTYDHEAAFPKCLCSPQEIDRFIRNTTLYVLRQGDIIKDGDTMDGPGNTR